MSVRLSYDTYEFIKEEVTDIFIRYHIDCVPISGFEVAIKMGIKLVPYSSLNRQKRQVVYTISGDGFYWEPGDGKEYIYYDDNQEYERINMTILHELGHCILGHWDKTSSEVAEAEANFFAKYAIAPPPLVHRIRPTCAEDIQDFFIISYEAACYAFSYYQKWLRYGGEYKEYEIKMLDEFDNWTIENSDKKRKRIQKLLA